MELNNNPNFNNSPAFNNNQNNEQNFAVINYVKKQKILKSTPSFYRKLAFNRSSVEDRGKYVPSKRCWIIFGIIAAVTVIAIVLPVCLTGHCSGSGNDSDSTTTTTTLETTTTTTTNSTTTTTAEIPVFGILLINILYYQFICTQDLL